MREIKFNHKISASCWFIYIQQDGARYIQCQISMECQFFFKILASGIDKRHLGCMFGEYEHSVLHVHGE